MEITQDMVDKANEEETAIMQQSPVVLIAQVNHLNQRVVLLKALVNEQERELEKLRKRKAPSDRQPRKAVAKKP